MSDPVARLRAIHIVPLFGPILVGCSMTGLAVHHASPEVFEARTIAFLPVVSDAETRRLDTRAMLGDALHRGNSDFNLVQVADLTLRQAGVEELYAAMIESYERTGVMNPESLRTIADALEVDHLLRTRVRHSEEEHPTSVLVDIHVQLWSAEPALLVWEATGRANEAANFVRVGDDPVGLALKNACSEIASGLSQPPQMIECYEPGPEWARYVGDTGVMRYTLTLCFGTLATIPAERRQFFATAGDLTAAGFGITDQFDCER